MTIEPNPGKVTGLRTLYQHLSGERRRQLHVLTWLMLLGAIADLATIGAVIPFLLLLADPAQVQSLAWAEGLFRFTGAGTGAERGTVAALVFGALAIVSGLVRLRLSWSTEDFAYRTGHELLVKTYRRVLQQPYTFHLNRNSSSLLAAIDKNETLIFNILLPLIQAATSAFIALVIVAGLAFIYPLVAFLAFAAFASTYIALSAFGRDLLARNSLAIATAWDERTKAAQESLGGVRDVILDNSQPLHVSHFERVDRRLTIARARTGFIASAPRYLVETLGILTIAALALYTVQVEGGIAGALPILGAVAISGQRLLPLMQTVYQGWSLSAGYWSVLGQIVELLELPLADSLGSADNVAPLKLSRSIRLENVGFTYPDAHAPSLDGITMDIGRGATIGLIGETGSGKSTLADLLMGLIEPTAGRILIDGTPMTGARRRAWQRSIAHVPQSIFLADASIARNIAMSVGDEPLDRNRIEAAARQAQLFDFVDALPKRFDTKVGERGIRLSGGQRQRLGIARAIYKQASVLILDEATSALDGATESAVIDALAALSAEGRTIIVIAHRMTTIAHCDLVANLHLGRLVEFGAFAQVVGAATASERERSGTGRGQLRGSGSNSPSVPD